MTHDIKVGDLKGWDILSSGNVYKVGKLKEQEWKLGSKNGLMKSWDFIDFGGKVFKKGDYVNANNFHVLKITNKTKYLYGLTSESLGLYYEFSRDFVDSSFEKAILSNDLNKKLYPNRIEKNGFLISPPEK